MSAVRLIGRLALTVVCWLTAAVIVSAAIDAAIGRRLPAIANGIGLLLVAPLLAKVWSVRWTKGLIAAWCVFAAFEAILVIRIITASG